MNYSKTDRNRIIAEFRNVDYADYQKDWNLLIWTMADMSEDISFKVAPEEIRQKWFKLDKMSVVGADKEKCFELITDILIWHKGLYAEFDDEF